MSPSHQTVRLHAGRHLTPRHGVCAVELASMLAGEHFTDRPRCPALAAFVRGYNDALDEHRRQDLIPIAAGLVGTRSAADGAALSNADALSRLARRYRRRGGLLRRRVRFGRLGRLDRCTVASLHLGRCANTADHIHAVVLAQLAEMTVSQPDLSTPFGVAAAEPPYAISRPH